MIKTTQRAGRPPRTPTAPAANRRYPWLRDVLLPALFIVACAAAAHAPAIGAGFVWDDDVSLTANPHLGDITGLSRLWLDVGTTKIYAPLAFSTLWVQHRLWGLDPTGYHVVNIALHALAAVLLWQLLKRLSPAGAFLAAAVFAVHPITVESVAWITEVRNVQSLALYLFCMLAFLRFAGLDGRAEGPRRADTAGFALVLLLFAAGLLSKPVGVGLPFVILLIAWWKRGRIERKDILVAAPMLAMSVAVGLLAVYVDKHYSGGSGTEWQMSLMERTLVAGRVVWFYAGKLFWPYPLISIYPRWDVNVAVWWQYLYPLGLVGVVSALWVSRERIGRGPLVAVCSFIVLVAPTSGLLNFSYQLYSFVADRYQYHASVALIALAATAATNLVCRSRLRGGPTFIVAAGVVVLALATLSARHAETFGSEKARCLATLEGNPNAWVAMNNLGVALNAEGRPDEAVRWYEKALEIRPVYPEAHSNLGVALVALGRIREAVPHYEEALRVWRDYPQAHNNLATALASLGDIAGAVAHYQAALTANSDYAEAHNNLAQLLTRTGDLAAAEKHHREALRIRPHYAEAHHDLGVTLAGARRYDEAVREYREALRLAPENVKSRTGLVAALTALGRTGEAQAESRELLRNHPKTARGHSELGLALAAEGKLNEAAAQFEEALRLDTGEAGAHTGLGNVLASRDDLPGAIAHYREAVRLKPEQVVARANLGKALASVGNLEEAIVVLQESVRRDDSLADVHNTLGVCLAQAGRLDEAVVHFKRAVSLDPNDVSARANLSRARGLKREPF